MNSFGLYILFDFCQFQIFQHILEFQIRRHCIVVIFRFLSHANSQIIIKQYQNLPITLIFTNEYKSDTCQLQIIFNITKTMQIIKSQVDQLKRLKPTKILEQLFALVIIVGSALALWKCLCVGFNTQCPVVVVLTGSMEPGYYRGDILFVYHQEKDIIPGDVVVYNLRTQPIPIVHRVLTVQERDDGNLYILTKGDNNNVDDRGLYPRGVSWLHREEIMGKMKFYLPYMGMFTIWLNDYAWFKFTVLGLMGFFVLIAKDPQ